MPHRKLDSLVQAILDALRESAGVEDPYALLRARLSFALASHGYVIRTAVVKGDPDPEEVARYLPPNYRVLPDADGLAIHGCDVAGWTLDGYVIPRLASGLITAVEQDL